MGLPAAFVRARRREALDFHQSCKAMHFGFLRHELGHDAAHPQRILAQIRAQPVVTGGRRITLVENQIDHFEHRRQALRSLLRAGQFEWNPRFRERAFGAHDPLGDRGLRSQKSARDFVGLQTAEQAQRERNACGLRQNRVTRDENKARQIVAVVGVVETRSNRLHSRQLAAELLALVREQRISPQPVDRAMLCRGHQPRTRLSGNAGLRPLLERGDERVLRHLFGDTDVAYDACQAGNQLRRLDPPDRVDRASDIRPGHATGHIRAFRRAARAFSLQLDAVPE